MTRFFLSRSLETKIGTWLSVDDAPIGRRMSLRPSSRSRERTILRVHSGGVSVDHTKILRTPYTIEGLLVGFSHTVVLTDLEDELLAGVLHHPDMIIIVDKVSGATELTQRPSRQCDIRYPSFSRSAGNAGSLGRLLESLRNIVDVGE